MAIEIEGRLGHNDYRLRKMTQILRDKDKELDAMRLSIDDLLAKAAAEREKLLKVIAEMEKKIRSLTQKAGYVGRRRKAIKPEVETTEKS